MSVWLEQRGDVSSLSGSGDTRTAKKERWLCCSLFGTQCPPVVPSSELLCRFLSALYPSGEYEKRLPPTRTQHAHTRTRARATLLCLSDSNPRERS